MRFVPYHLLNSIPSIIVDGAAAPGTVLTLSHWPKSGTPANLKRDTSAEIVFAYLDDVSSHVQAEAVSNNHFDEDGLVGIFVLLDPEAAAKHRALLVDAARAGDFGVYKSREAARLAFVLGACSNRATSPLSAHIFNMPYPQMAGEFYRESLALLPRVLANLDDFKPLWEMEDEKLSVTEEWIEKGTVTIEENAAADLAVINIPMDIPAQLIHSFALYSHTPCTRVLLVQGQHVEFRYRYESWVQMASRRPPLRVDLTDLAAELNQQEKSGGRWTFDRVDNITPRLHLEASAKTSLPPAFIQTLLERRLLNDSAAWNPYD